MKSRIIFYLLFIPLLIVGGWLGYVVYGNWLKYQEIQTSQKYIDLIDSVGIDVENIKNEKINSAIFMGSKGTERKKKLQESRRLVDQALKNTANEVSKYEIFEHDIGTAITGPKSIIEARAAVDTLSGDYETIFHITYYKEIASPLIKIVKNVPKKHLSQAIEAYYATYIQLLEGIDRIGSEQAYMSYIIKRLKKLENNDIQYWEILLSHDMFPSLDHLKDRDIVRDMESIFVDRKMIEDIDRLRADIFSHALDAQYSQITADIDKIYTPIYKKMGDAITVLSQKIKASLSATLDTLKKESIRYGLAFLFVLLALGLLFKVFSRAAKEKKALESALRAMVSHLDSERQKELETIIHKGDTVATYRFLAKTTQEAHEAREVAIEAEKAKDAFLANMSHEIRTPLNGILGFTQLLTGTELDTEQREFLEVVEVSSNNLLHIVNDILDLSKIKADKMELEHIAFSAIDTLNEAVEPHEKMASDKQIEYTTFIDPTLPNLMGDPIKISQIMTNLIGNAMKFTDYQGIVNVTVEKVKELDAEVTVRFCVKDNGLGVSPEQKEHIFQAFSQADTTTTRKFGGTGLGLTITNNLVERMGGTLDLVSEIGEGSEFYFTLTFEKSTNNTTIVDSFPSLRIGYLKPANTEIKTVEKNLKKYIEATGAYMEEFNMMVHGAIASYDAVIVDYSFKEIRENIALIQESANHLIVLTYIAYSHDIKMIQDQVNTVIYKPLNIIKIMRALEKVVSNDLVPDKTMVDTPMSIIPTASPAKVSFANLSILVAEDNSINQKLISEIIKKLGANIEIADNGEEAVRLYKDNQYDIVFMDIQMPVLGGIEATQMIIEWEEINQLKHKPIVALTANALHGDKEKYLQAGMDDYIAKPIDIRDLEAILTKYNVAEPIITDSQEERKKIFEEVSVNTEQTLVENRTLDLDNMNTKSKNILLYSTNTLVGNIHRVTLAKIGYRVDFVSDTDTILVMAEQKEYRCILVDSTLLTDDLCLVLEVFADIGVEPMIRVNSQDYLCSQFKHYNSVEELRKVLAIV